MFQKTARCNTTNRVVFKSRVPFQVQVERLTTPLEGRRYRIEAADGEVFEGVLDAQGKTEEVRLVEGETRFWVLGDGASELDHSAGQGETIETGGLAGAREPEDVPPPELTIVDPDDASVPPTAGVFLGREARFKAQVEPTGHDPRFQWTCADAAVELVAADQQVVTVKASALPADPDQELELSCTVTTAGGEDQATHTFKVLDVRLHLDADRDGKVDEDPEGLETWSWGEEAKGAIVLCNADDERGDGVPDYDSPGVDAVEDLGDLAPLDVRRPGGKLPAGWSVRLSAAPAGAVRVFSARAEGAVELIGPDQGDACTLEDLPEDRELAVEGLRFPHADFPDGEVTLTLQVLDAAGAVAGERKAVLRVAPWMMLHHLLSSEQVFVMAVDVPRRDGGNVEFRRDLLQGLRRAGLPGAVEVPSAKWGGDRWMQDAMEVGFTAAPGQAPFPVALRTANDRASMNWGSIDRYPKQELLGPDFGWVQALPPARGSSLDSFGNLEVSPPVEVEGQKYPFGRIVYGDGGGETMRKEVIDFLRAQRVQAPFAVDTGWLRVGHVDEFLTFLPTRTGRFGFKLGLASPRLALEILRDLSARGQGGVWLFEGEIGDYAQVQPGDDAEALLARWKAGLDPADAMLSSKQAIQPSDLPRLNPMFSRHAPDEPAGAAERLGASGRNAAHLLPGESIRVFPDLGRGRSYKWLTPDAVLQDPGMVQAQEQVQAKVDANRAILLRELGIDDDDVVELPILFAPGRSSIAYTPGVVNMLVVTREGQHGLLQRMAGAVWRGKRSRGSYSSSATREKLSTSAVCCVPKPYGPVVGGVCQFEQAVERALDELGLDVQFVDDLWSYHVMEGEVHCGTNTLRTAPSHQGWWEVEPPAVEP